MKELLKDIDKSVDCLVELGKEIIGKRPLYTYDLYCTIVLNRCLNLLNGFTGLMRGNNYTAAVPLVKSYLDLLLQLYASTLVLYSMDEFAKKIFKGRKIRYMKDAEGRTMNETYLIKKLSKQEGLGWMLDLYNLERAYEHYNDYIAASSANVNSFLEDDNNVMTIILSEDGFVSDAEKLELAIKINQITAVIVNFITQWKVQKEVSFKTRVYKRRMA